MRNRLDQYDTPAWCVERILPQVITPQTVGVCDPCAGAGAILDVVREHYPKLRTTGLELDPALAAARQDVEQADATRAWTVPPQTAVITNPPYSWAEEILTRCLAEAGLVVALLRLGFVAGQRRRAFWEAHPADVYVLPKRPSFTGGGTDRTEYAWFAWGEARGGRWGRLEDAR